MDGFKEVYDAIMASGIVSSQTEFAQRTGISRTVISQLLNGKRTLSEQTLHRLCTAFPFLNKQWLISREGQMFDYYNGVDEVGNPFLTSFVNGVATQDILMEEERKHPWEQAGRKPLAQEDEGTMAFMSYKASLYDQKAKEVTDLYSRLSEKEAEISKLHKLILNERTITRQLRERILELTKQLDETERD